MDEGTLPGTQKCHWNAFQNVNGKQIRIAIRQNCGEPFLKTLSLGLSGFQESGALRLTNVDAELGDERLGLGLHTHKYQKQPSK